MDLQDGFLTSMQGRLPWMVKIDNIHGIFMLSLHFFWAANPLFSLYCAKYYNLTHATCMQESKPWLTMNGQESMR
jgi:hypothetical protein